MPLNAASLKKAQIRRLPHAGPWLKSVNRGRRPARVEGRGRAGRLGRITDARASECWQARWSVENNLSIANMDWEEFADAVDDAGIFRGFLEAVTCAPAGSNTDHPT